LTGPWATPKESAPEPANDMLSEAGYPDLQRWVRFYGGYTRIDWARWTAAMARAHSRGGKQ
jgi:hypothetical protein